MTTNLPKALRYHAGSVMPKVIATGAAAEIDRLTAVVEKAQRLLSVVEIAPIDQADYDAVMAAGDPASPASNI